MGEALVRNESRNFFNWSHYQQKHNGKLYTKGCSRDVNHWKKMPDSGEIPTVYLWQQSALAIRNLLSAP